MKLKNKLFAGAGVLACAAGLMLGPAGLASAATSAGKVHGSLSAAVSEGTKAAPAVKATGSVHAATSCSFAGLTGTEVIVLDETTLDDWAVYIQPGLDPIYANKSPGDLMCDAYDHTNGFWYFKDLTRGTYLGLAESETGGFFMSGIYNETDPETAMVLHCWGNGTHYLYMSPAIQDTYDTWTDSGKLVEFQPTSHDLVSPVYIAGECGA